MLACVCGGVTLNRTHVIYSTSVIVLAFMSFEYFPSRVIKCKSVETLVARLA